ncbi:MAG: AAA family ATPase [Patescibacteria group bacterium]
MYLSRMELQGFKTFAQKTTLLFAAPKKGDHAVTVIVGPNGSGKSNIADGIRWCLGEQSMKLLRGKAAQDVIFSGAEGRSRAGFAEVSLTFDNSDHTLNVSFSEVVVTRRLYRDGESEYLLNGSVVRLADIQLLLAEAGVGQRSYSVIGQGMIDHVLTASPEDRKVFFDDATGVRGFQIKRHQALLKLQKSAENLADVEMVLRELEPRLNMLKRQVKRLNDREVVAAELKEVSAQYFGVQWWNLIDEKNLVDGRSKIAMERVAAKKAELATGDARLAAIEAAQMPNVNDDGSMSGLQMAYKKAQQDLADARRVHFAAERDLELAKVASQTTWAPLPLPDIIAEVRDVSAAHESLLLRLKAVSDLADLVPIISDLESISTRSKKLRERLTRPNPDDFAPSAEMVNAISVALEGVHACEAGVKAVEVAIDEKSKATVTATNEVFGVQREVRRLQQELSGLEAQSNAVAIEIARCETRIEGLKKEMEDAVPELVASIVADRPSETPFLTKEGLGEVVLHDKMLRLRHQLELIGGIEETVVAEYKEADERFTFLSTQVADLRDAIASTEKVIDELDVQIREQSDVAFKAIATEFQKYFAILFGGGRCSLVKLTKEELEDGSLDASSHPRVGGDPLVLDELVHHDDVDTLEAITRRVLERKDAIVGIDIQATPPGKRLKALNLLSGGERALTSIALVSAIMATNPAPFVVLDEVDAALDEANTVRFANILNELRKLTQFIVITHNRATMEKADMLYGVTMGDDGISKMLSVKLEDYVGDGTARR